MPESLSAREAADMLGVTPQHLRLLIESGQLLAERVGNRYVVDVSSLVSLRYARRAVAHLDDGPGVSSMSPRSRWQQWAGSDNPDDAIEKLRARAHERTRGTTLENSTEILREMREERHAK